MGKIKTGLDWCVCCSQRKHCFLRSIINGLAWKRRHASGGRNRSHSSCIHSLASLLILSWVYFLKRKECGWETYSSVLNASFAATKWLYPLSPLTPLTQSLHSGWSCTSETLSMEALTASMNRLMCHMLLLPTEQLWYRQLLFNMDRKSKRNFKQTNKAVRNILNCKTLWNFDYVGFVFSASL